MIDKKTIDTGDKRDIETGDDRQEIVSKKVISFPPLLFAVLLYNIAGLFFFDGVEGVLFSLELFSGSVLFLNWGNISVLLGLLIFFISLLRLGTHRSSSLSRRGYSLMLVIFCFFELLVISYAATFSFLILLVLCVLDILCDYLLSQRYVLE